MRQPSVYRDIAAPATGPLLALVLSLTRLAKGEGMSEGVFWALLSAAVVVGARFGGRSSALVTAALGAFAVALTSGESDSVATAIAVAALVEVALLAGELQDRAERAERAAAVANQRLRRATLHDSLTGLRDRRGFEVALGVEIAREARRAGAFALLLLEVSGVRAASEPFGRSVGDTVIQILADAIEQHIRQSDISGRVADDQFAVILPDTNTRGAEVMAGQILARFFDDLRGTVPSALVARGRFAVSLFPDDGRDIDTLLTRASRRLEEPPEGTSLGSP